MRTKDGYIVHKCLNGEPEAFGLLVDKYKASIYALAYAKLGNFQDAEDVAQEVFIKAYRNLRKLRHWDSFFAWLYSITSNLCKNLIHEQSRRPDREAIQDQLPQTLISLATDSHRENMLYESLYDALDSLPEIYRKVLILYYFGDMNSYEIARFLGASPATIRQRLSRARTQLKEEMVAMMDTAFEGQKLQASFTFRVVEVVKHIKIHPVSVSRGLPWGLSMAAGIILAVLSLNPNMSLLNPMAIPAGSPLPGEAKALRNGEVPVDMVEVAQMQAISGKQDDIAELALAVETKADSDKGQIIFVKNSNIWVMDADGKNEKQLTKGGGQILYPAWSSDGTRIAFFHKWGGPNPGIYIMNADGSSVKQLTNDPGDCYPTWSPDGKQIAFVRDGGGKSDIYVMDSDGANVKRLIEGRPFFVSLDWSPDARKIAFTQQVATEPDQVWVMDADGSNQEMLNSWGSFPAWSPDGKQIAFHSGRAGQNPWKSSDIYVMDADGSNVKILTEPGPVWDYYPTWSPDGKKIAFFSDRDGNREIYVMNADGSNVQRLTNTPAGEYWPHWAASSYAVEPARKLRFTWGKIKQEPFPS